MVSNPKATRVGTHSRANKQSHESHPCDACMTLYTCFICRMDVAYLSTPVSVSTGQSSCEVMASARGVHAQCCTAIWIVVPVQHDAKLGCATAICCNVCSITRLEHEGEEGRVDGLALAIFFAVQNGRRGSNVFIVPLLVIVRLIYMCLRVLVVLLAMQSAPLQRAT